jgi:hypothetical protein
MSHNQNAGQYYEDRYKSFENVAKFKYMGATVTNKNFIHDKVKSRLTSTNACFRIFHPPVYLNHKEQNIHNYNIICSFVWM